jgi:molybdopterin-binding protein
MPQIRISEIAGLLGVSDDTVRRWISTERLPATRDEAGRMVVDGEHVAAFAREQAEAGAHGDRTSARNRLGGIVTEVRREGLMAQVEVAAGRFRLVSLMTRDAAEEMGLRPGVRATVVVKATTAIVEADRGHG